MFIYLTTNLINGKKYVGRCAYNEKTSHRGRHYLGSGTFLKMAIAKYGKENFKREILERLPNDGTKHDLRECEYKWIKILDAPNDPSFYNISWNNGGFGKGDIMSEAQKKKISKVMKEKVYKNGLPPEWKKNVAKAAKGRIPWNKGKTFSPEEKKRIYGKRTPRKKYSNEQLREIREKHASGLAAYRIAEEFGCSHHTILKIVKFEGKYAIIEGGSHP
jgi:group I intron endonuclease